MTYETLLNEAYEKGLIVKEKPLISCDGRIKGNRIAIRQDIGTSSKKACVLAEELAHHELTVGNIVHLSDMDQLRQEHKARVKAYEKLLSVARICEAAAKGYTQPHEMAEYLDVDEEFLREYLVYQGILDISL